MKPLAFLLLLISFSALSQTGYKIGDKVSAFTLVNAVDNNNISLADYSKAKGVVVIFTSNDCPYSRLYEDRLLQLYKEFESKGIIFIFINPNDPKISPEDSKEEMVKKAEARSYPFHYLIDSRQETASQFGATKTPEVFVLKIINGSFVLQYKGAIDDNPQVAADASAFYLKNAIIGVVNNTAIKVTEKRATGCMIKK